MNNKNNILARLAAILAVFTVIFFMLGFSAVREAAILGLWLVLPTYLLINKLFEDKDEVFIFSLFIGPGITAAVTYWLGLLIGSVKYATTIIAAVAIIASFFLNKKKDTGKDN